MIDYRATTDSSDPDIVRFFEQYENATAFEAHTQTDHFQEFEAALPDLLAGEPEVIQFKVESATEKIRVYSIPALRISTNEWTFVTSTSDWYPRTVTMSATPRHLHRR